MGLKDIEPKTKRTIIICGTLLMGGLIIAAAATGTMTELFGFFMGLIPGK